MLQPIREHALAHVATEPTVDRDRHLDYYLGSLGAAYELFGSSNSGPLSELISNELHNLAALHEWALECGRIDDDMRLYRPLNMAHLFDRPEPFLWARDTVQLPAAVNSSHRDLFIDALHAAWYSALFLQLDFGLALTDPYVRYIADSVGSSVRLVEANRKDIDDASAIDAAGESIEKSLVWARSIGAASFVAGLLEQQAQVELAAGRIGQARELAAQAEHQAAALGMGHVQAQAQFQMVRCDVAEGQFNPTTAERLADALDQGVRASAQARLRWQLPLAARIFVAHERHSDAAVCLAAGGFVPEARGAFDALPPADRAAGAERARQLSLLDVATIAIEELRKLAAVASAAAP